MFKKSCGNLLNPKRRLSFGSVEAMELQRQPNNMTSPREITGNLIVDKGFSEHDAIQMKIDALNIRLGLKTIMGGAWTYDRLSKNAASKLGITYADAHRLGIDALIEQV